MTIQRFSSRRDRLDCSFLNPRLQDAQSYDRIAGYFSSSMLEVAGETLETVAGIVRVACNSDLDVRDVEAAKSAANYAMRREWCASEPEYKSHFAKPRFERLYQFLRSGKMQVKVLPREKFGLVHGKAGVITLADGRKTAFMGSINETYNAWKLNYELVWEDNSDEAVQWVQEEFNALWQHPLAVNLAEFVIEDVGRVAHRSVFPNIETWRQFPDQTIKVGAPIIETPIYRKEYGLWAHQKYFINLAFEAHQRPDGARFILADMVGLGKTMQLAIAAMLMALYGDKPVLILVPKPLLLQWQDEMWNLLELPSAVWNGKQWVDENGLEYPAIGASGIKQCPRRIGIVSQGLITRGTEAADYLKQMKYECVIVDEAHRARRENLGTDCEKEKPAPNNLLAFLLELGSNTKSLLLATATPVQMYPVEAWDLLNVLAVGNESLLGNTWSYWRNAEQALAMAMGRQDLPAEERDRWQWIRNPLPPASEGSDFTNIRRSLGLSDDKAVPSGDAWDKLRPPDKRSIQRLARDFAKYHNPFIRFIVRRTREFLETTQDPETGEPYLPKVNVRLFGETDADAIKLSPYLSEAYSIAEEFCQQLGQRMKGSGFLKTLLLRRVGSTIYAGLNTANKMLGDWEDIDETDNDDDEPEEKPKSLTPTERELLSRFVNALLAHQDNDPKYEIVWSLLLEEGWLDRGCIIFSQYFDSIQWLSQQLTQDLPKGEIIGIYAGGNKSGIMVDGEFTRLERYKIKEMVRQAEIRLMLGTDAASEGLNLQRLGSLINLDLPWNPTRLEQRKGRIQRIGQTRETVFIYNMRYKGSVEDRVHNLLSDRLAAIHQLFGQVPDILKTVWIDEALGNREKAKQTIAAIPQQHPFEFKYHQIQKVKWESCEKVLDRSDRKQYLIQGWRSLV
jgi:superfamily II DNA or RNA helicase